MLRRLKRAENFFKWNFFIDHLEIHLVKCAVPYQQKTINDIEGQYKLDPRIVGGQKAHLGDVPGIVWRNLNFFHFLALTEFLLFFGFFEFLWNIFVVYFNNIFNSCQHAALGMSHTFTSPFSISRKNTISKIQTIIWTR